MLIIYIYIYRPGSCKFAYLYTIYSRDFIINFANLLLYHVNQIYIYIFSQSLPSLCHVNHLFPIFPLIYFLSSSNYSLPFLALLLIIPYFIVTFPLTSPLLFWLFFFPIFFPINLILLPLNISLLFSPCSSKKKKWLLFFFLLIYFFFFFYLFF